MRPQTAASMICGARFEIAAAAEASVLCRLLGMLAQLGYVPATVHARRCDDRLRIVIRQPGMAEHAARIVAEKMRSLVAVCSVELTPAGEAHAPQHSSDAGLAVQQRDSCPAQR